MHRFNWHQKHVQSSSRGDLIADTVVARMGSWPFIIYQTIVVILWITGNVFFGFIQFDKYPFILLNLLFSTQAAYASPLILMASNRQAARDKMQAEHQYKHQEKELVVNTELTREIHTLVTEVHKLVGGNKKP